MSATTEVGELEKLDEQLQLRRIAGKTSNIEINKRTLEAFRQEYRKKGLGRKVRTTHRMILLLLQS
jgi:hypothetical protein